MSGFLKLAEALPHSQLTSLSLAGNSRLDDDAIGRRVELLDQRQQAMRAIEAAAGSRVELAL